MIAARREISMFINSPARLAVNRNQWHGDCWCSAVSSGLLRICKRARRIAGLKSLAPKFLTVCVILCSMALAGCARNPAQREVSQALHEGKAPPIRAAVRTRRYSEQYRYAAPRIRRPDATLLSPQPAPDCEFNGSDLKTVDPVEWARLKTEYERQCYQDAEKAARDRLALLQTSSTCEIEPVRQRQSGSTTIRAVAIGRVSSLPASQRLACSPTTAALACKIFIQKRSIGAH